MAEKLEPKLYELAAEFRATADKLMEADLPEEVIRDTLEGCAMEFEDKAVSVACMIRNIEVAASAITESMAAQAKRVKALEDRAEWLRSYLIANMNSVGCTKVEKPLLKLALQSNKATVVIEGEVPDDYMVYPPAPPAPPPRPDKEAIRVALEGGREVAGARLFRGQRLVIK